LPAVAPAGGVALFFAADVGYRWRDHRQLATTTSSLLSAPPRSSRSP
jgi:hypothetical protein